MDFQARSVEALDTGVELKPTAHPPVPADSHASAAPSVAIIIVTWNRREHVLRVLGALAALDYPIARLHVHVIDNAGTDGTTDAIVARWGPDAIIENPTTEAHRPAFAPEPASPPAGADAHDPAHAAAQRSVRRHPFARLCIVRNAHNHGGCGGFNTGFAYVAQRVRPEPDYLWLVDDDIDLPPDCLRHLVSAANADPAIGLVGSRTVHFDQRDLTIETTIYLDARRGAMADEPPPGHRLAESHRAWAASAGGVRGRNSYSGLREVDVVSACSMLARWSGVKRVGFWDWRYFIYCDDADWCLRFARAGYRVVLSLDAVVYHLPWHHKLTCARLYYAQRNVVWMLQKVYAGSTLRSLVRRRLLAMLKDSLRASFMRRLFHAEIIRLTALDVVRQRPGRFSYAEPPAEPIADALRRTGCTVPAARRAADAGHPAGAEIAVLCSHPASVAWAADLRDRAEASRAPADAPPQWTWIVWNSIWEQNSRSEKPVDARGARVVLYGGKFLSRFIKRPLSLLLNPPHAFVVFDQTNDLPALTSAWNIHIDQKNPAAAQVERDSPLRRVAFLARWCGTAARALVYSRTVRPYRSTDPYGGFPAASDSQPPTHAAHRLAPAPHSSTP